MTCFHYVLTGGLGVYTKSLKTPEGHLQPPGVLTLDHFCRKKDGDQVNNYANHNVK